MAVRRDSCQASNERITLLCEQANVCMCLCAILSYSYLHVCWIFSVWLNPAHFQSVAQTLKLCVTAGLTTCPGFISNSCESLWECDAATFAWEGCRTNAFFVLLLSFLSPTFIYPPMSTALIAIGQYSSTIETVDAGWCKDITDQGATQIAQSSKSLRYLGLMRCDKVTQTPPTKFTPPTLSAHSLYAPCTIPCLKTEMYWKIQISFIFSHLHCLVRILRLRQLIFGQVVLVPDQTSQKSSLFAGSNAL